MPVSIFVSFCSKDQKKKDYLVQLLEKSPNLFRPIIVADRDKPSTQLSDKVKEAILEATFFISIITKTSIKTQWVNQEIGFAVAKNRYIIPLVSMSTLHKLKAFIHDKLDLPFYFNDSILNKVLNKEQASFSHSCEKLVDHLKTLGIPTASRQSFKIPEKVGIQDIASIVYQLYPEYRVGHTRIIFPETSNESTNTHSHSSNGYFNWLNKNNVRSYKFKFFDKTFKDNYFEIEVNHEEGKLECLCHLNANRNDGFLKSLGARINEFEVKSGLT